MTKPIKALTIGLWMTAVIAMIGAVAMQARQRQSAQAGAAAAESIPVAAQSFNDPSDNGPHWTGIDAPAFALTDQRGRAVTLDQLKGHPWVADFIFTTCASACPRMTQHLSELQAQIPSAVPFISFSVDPEHDTPDVLLKYAAAYNADNDRWHFLTGDKAKVYAAVAAMKVGVVRNGDTPMDHDSHFFLVDASGHVCGLYDSSSNQDGARMIQDIKTLIAEGGSVKP